MNNDSTTYEAARNRQPTAEVAFPASMNPGPNAYGVRIAGDCLLPDFSDGEAVACDPDAPLAAGDFVAIWWKAERPPIIKRLAFSVPPEDLRGLEGFSWVAFCEQSNPRRRYCIPGEEVAAIHKVLGRARLV